MSSHENGFCVTTGKNNEEDIQYQMPDDLRSALMGGLFGILGSIVGALVNHMLMSGYQRRVTKLAQQEVDKAKKQKESEELRSKLLEGVSEFSIEVAKKRIDQEVSRRTPRYMLNTIQPYIVLLFTMIVVALLNGGVAWAVVAFWILFFPGYMIIVSPFTRNRIIAIAKVEKEYNSDAEQ